MRKNLLLLLLFCISEITNAQDEPVITLTATTDATTNGLSFSFAAIDAATKMQIDWGDGTKVETEIVPVLTDPLETISITGIPKGDGIIKIYGTKLALFESLWGTESPKITSINVSKATDLQRLTIGSHALTTLDVTKNVLLTELTCNGNQLTTLDVTKNIELKTLDCKTNAIKKLDIAKCNKLTKLDAQNNLLSKIVLTNNMELSSAYLLNNSIGDIDCSKNTKLKTLNLNNNKLKSLDVTNCEILEVLFCMNNNIAELKVASVKTTLNCAGNKLKMSALPAVNPKKYLCVPQRIIPNYLQEGDIIDFSSEVNIKGLGETAQPTIFIWKAGSTILKENTDYTTTNGKFTFSKAQTSPIVCEITNSTAFPALVGTKVFKTSTAEFYEPTELITLKAETTATDPLSLDFATLGTGIKFQIDWGNGTKIPTEEIAITDDYGTKTTVSGKPLGEGTVKVYGIKLAEFQAMWTKSTETNTYPKISSIDVTKAIDLQNLTVASHALAAIDISKNAKLTELTCYGNLFQSLAPISPSLLKLDCKSNQLTTLDISQCPKLTKLDAQGNLLTQVNLVSNVELDNVLLLNNKIENIDCSTNTKITLLNLNNNKLSSLDVTKCVVLDRLFCMSNNLTELKAGNITSVINCSNNRFTFATLPSIATKSYTYTPQADLTISAAINVETELDLSAQNNAKGILDTPQATTYTWKTADGSKILVAGQDYTESNGKFTFKAAQVQPVYCEMATPAFPAFTGGKILKTTKATINAAPVNINSESANTVKIYTGGKSLMVYGLNGNENIKIFSIQGSKIAEMNTTSSEVTFNLNAGQYIILIDNIAYKAIIR